MHGRASPLRTSMYTGSRKLPAALFACSALLRASTWRASLPALACSFVLRSVEGPVPQEGHSVEPFESSRTPTESRRPGLSPSVLKANCPPNHTIRYGGSIGWYRAETAVSLTLRLSDFNRRGIGTGLILHKQPVFIFPNRDGLGAVALHDSRLRPVRWDARPQREGKVVPGII